MMKIEERLINGVLTECKCYYYITKSGHNYCRVVRPIRPRKKLDKPRSDKGSKRINFNKKPT